MNGHPIKIKRIKGRGTSINPVNRFKPIEIEVDGDWLDYDQEERKVKTVYFEDSTRAILSKNDSPDIPFTYSLNPYRGCEHGCIYCYARPTHEFFELSSGLDFETKIFVKREAAQLLELNFMKRSWQPQVIAMSGITDCYQPIERKLEITRGCLEVFLRFRNPVGIVTKNALITRDIHLLQELAALNLVGIAISITTLDNKLCRKMEPRTSAPEQRLRTIEKLANAGIPVGVNVAPIIPGLTDHEMPAIIAAAVDHGAMRAGYTMVRLPYALKDLFSDWLRLHFPDRAEKVLNAIREVRNGQLYDSQWGIRMSGIGERAEAIARLFEVCCNKHNLNRTLTPLTTEHFRRSPTQQIDLFAA